MNEEDIYEFISEEIDSGKIKKGVWTKALSEAEGDENKTKAIYIKLRFEKLSNEKIEKNIEFTGVWEKLYDETGGDEKIAVKIYNDYKNKISPESAINKEVIIKEDLKLN